MTEMTGFANGDANARDKVFLSWSGDVAGSLADGFREAIDQYFGIQCFLSRKDIGTGTEWATRLSQALRECTFAIAFLTPSSIRSDYVLWEAGALWKHYAETRKICPVLVCVSKEEIPEPFRVFQFIELRLLTKIVGGQQVPDEERLKKRVAPIFKSLCEAFGNQGNQEALFNAAWAPLSQRVFECIDRAKAEKNPLQADLMRLRRKVDGLELRLQVLCNLVEGPAYFMNHKYDIVFANLAARVFFKISAPPTLPFEKFWSSVSANIENKDEIEKNMADNFLNHSTPPNFDFEEILYNHPKYGRIKIHKAGVALPDRVGGVPVGWVVIFNFETVERADRYYQDHQIAVEAAVDWCRPLSKTLNNTDSSIFKLNEGAAGA